MNWTPAAAVALMLSACAAPQPIPRCDRPEIPPYARSDACRDSGGARDSADATMTKAVRDTPPSKPTTVDTQKPTPPTAPPSAPPAAPPTPDTPDPDPDTPAPDTADPGTRTKGNASANNGKGGNYDRTGHVDNGKGMGRHRK